MIASSASAERRSYLSMMAAISVALALAYALGFPPPGLAQSHPASASVDSGRIAVPGSTLFYEAAGSGPVVILLHAGNLDRRIWDSQFLPLAARYRVVRYDARGLGRSGPIAGPFSQLADLEAVVHHFGTAQVDLVGCSLGGATAIDFAIAHPHAVRALILVDGGLSGWVWAAEDRNVPWRVAARAAASRGDTIGIARAWLLSDYLAPAAQDPLVAARLDSLLGDNVGYWKSLLAHGDQELAAPAAVGRLGSIRARTLIIVGSRDTPEIQRIADTLAAGVPGARKVIMDGVGHIPSLEQPGRFLAIAQSFLAGSR